MWWSLIQVVLLVITLIITLAFCFFKFVSWMLTKLFLSIEPVGPDTLCNNNNNGNNNEDNERNPLFRHIPKLKEKLAWEELGIYPTPIHRAGLQKPDKKISFWIKREDLSSPVYGGNKVRTLQYQLPACVAHKEKNPDAKFYVMGTGGSNNVVATMAHGAPLGLKFHVCYPDGDAPDFDNTLNILSMFSLGPLAVMLWDKAFEQLKLLISVVTSTRDKVFGLGGNSIGGILGQIGAALELAEQISRGEVPDVDEIYLPTGSSCTTTGLILGVCLARHLKLNAFQSPNFRIVSVAIHHGVAAMNRNTNMMQNWIGKYLSMSPRFGIYRASAYLQKLCGIDLTESALRFLETEWELVDDPEYVGIYGEHSIKSRPACALDTELQLEGKCPEWLSTIPQPWLCGHFSGKAFAVMLNRLENTEESVNALFWLTKSSIQPLGENDEWTALKEKSKSCTILKQWSDKGKAESVLRPGKVDIDNGTSQDYRHIMTPVGHHL